MSKQYARPSPDEIRQRLNPIQFRVTQQHGTEPPFQNEFWNNHAAGLYVDIVSGEPLFSSKDKFESGTGWPSFTRPVVDENVKEITDSSHGMRRVEVRSAHGDSHLGHVFDDGPKPTGLRYCINSASLRFIPLAKLDAEGYGEFRSIVETGVATAAKTDNACAVPQKGYTPLSPDKMSKPGALYLSQKAASCEATLEVAILAGGCFWGMEDILREVDGVIDTEVGYTGGSTPNPTYPQVKTGETGHAEALKVTFDPSKITFAELLETWFFKMHDPTTPNRQGNDVGSQYRSAIFYTSAAQKKTAEEIIARVNASGAWRKPVATEITPASEFTNAEAYHQDYLVKNPGGYTCHYLRD